MPNANFTKQMNLWVQTVAIIVAGIWAGYTFIYNEMIAPKLKPTTVNSQLELTRLGNHENIQAVGVKLILTNPTTRRLHVLPSVFTVYGELLDHNLISFGTFTSNIKSLNDSDDIVMSKYKTIKNKELLSVGKVFDDWVFEPNETSSRSFVIEVPKGEYDNIICYAKILTFDEDNNAVTAEWKLGEDNELDYNLFKIIKDKSGVEEKRTMYQDTDKIYSSLGSITTVAMLNLWEKNEQVKLHGQRRR